MHVAYTAPTLLIYSCRMFIIEIDVLQHKYIYQNQN